MDKLTDIKSKRFKFMEILYEATDGNQHAFVNMSEIGKELGFNRKETDLITQYLEGEGLIKFVALGGEISITHYGVTQVEEALSEPDKPTEYFPPINIINVQNMIGSQVQQGTTNSTQRETFSTSDIDKLTDFIQELDTKVSQLNLKPEDKDELDAEISTIKVQSSSSRPKPLIIKESLKTIRNLLEGMTGSILATELLNKLSNIIF
ncbi:hypothetical protein [Clostridium ljungdahlii]|uniref:Uncharacterized protein n=1 Tax=Clostridium ljungdahlii TaxID=1538 RepID=A0A162L5H1_9CLOT|nr:hypothetical protein [Clostridium ljungdahlii]OAA84678.1 hypothetical protein WY13_02577 [Clostridium ljungdahlii]